MYALRLGILGAVVAVLAVYFKDPARGPEAVFDGLHEPAFLACQ